MSQNDKVRMRFKRAAMWIAGTAIVVFALLPFPIGCGMVFPILDEIHGHPERPHGELPQELVGLWVREEPELFNFRGEAFFLMKDANVAGTVGMTRRRWHAEGDTLYIDSRSMCGNCYVGVVTAAYKVEFDGTERIKLAKLGSIARKEPDGWYRRLVPTDKFREEMVKLKESESDLASFHARAVLTAIEQSERFPEPRY